MCVRVRTSVRGVVGASETCDEKTKAEALVTDGRRRRRWQRDASRALERYIVATTGAGLVRSVPGYSFGGTLGATDVVVIEPRVANAWLLRYRPADVRLGSKLTDIFDSVAVIVPEQAATYALDLYPRHIGLHALGYLNGRPTLTSVREALVQQATDIAALGSLLWRDDIASLLISSDQDAHPFAMRRELLEMLFRCCSPTEARIKILEYLLK